MASTATIQKISIPVESNFTDAMFYLLQGNKRNEEHSTHHSYSCR